MVVGTKVVISVGLLSSEFIDNLINLLMDKYSVNAERIYSTGMSNGGFFSFHLACNLNASFAAIASVTGSMSYETFENCNARKPTPVLQIHGSIDTVVPYNGIESIMKPVSEVIEYWKLMTTISITLQNKSI